MREYSLSNTDEGVAIFTSDALSEIQDLDSTQSSKALTAIVSCLESPVPESVIEKTYETCQELQQLRQGELRLYVLLITEAPKYNILWVFAVKKHQYRNIGKFDAKACGKAKLLRKATKSHIETLLEREDALTVDELKNLRETV